MQTSVQNTARITDIIYFHGMTLQVITYEGIKYVTARNLVDLAGLDWRTAKRSLLDEENILLYAVKLFKSPVIAAQSGSPTTPNDVIHIQLNRAYFYLARINTKIMKAMGKATAAEKLLNLQIEWAQVLHDYETKGVAIKDKNKTDTAELMNLMKLRQMANPTEKIAFTHLLHQKMTELGLPISNQQQDLLNQ
ncbi:phage antirepressor N-terminal domain-containing protein [Acinetobacter sp. ANC 3832]|uniref:phage antirepressor N-terminal domain-containing protein n=1 Tax=Acinetobacter sp. ANC 3832 TaxID=1977874 RepID=UPI000A35993D|nr:phage antirepressor N-terminal domain-containing protein [Acinetobacter sp. ANC 3832]OTG94240.1 hypothetical protein B9T35_07485 [Acinetobacter sp. ANC 3832]